MLLNTLLAARLSFGLRPAGSGPYTAAIAAPEASGTNPLRG